MSRRSVADRWTVITWHKEGLTVPEIYYKTGFDQRFIRRWISRFESGAAIQDSDRTGRPRKRTTKVEQIIERKMRGKRRRSSRVVARDLKRQKIVDISYSTVQRGAHARGLRPFRRRITSRLTPKHKKDRLRFASANRNKDWSKVVFSDEHKFKQFKGGNPVHDQVWAKSPSEVPGKEVERWGLTVDVWAGISMLGKTELFIYEGCLDAQNYQDILRQRLVSAAQEWFEDAKCGWELQQDKATCHTAKSTMRFLEEQALRWWKGGPPRVTTSTQWRTFGRSSMNGWRTKNLKLKSGWRGQYVRFGKTSMIFC